MNTRAMHGMVSRRLASDDIAFEYVTETDSGDGSAEVMTNIVLLKGSVLPLQAKDIARLEKAGIITKNGVTIVISECPEEQPDRIVHAGKTYRVLNWTFDYSYTLGSGRYGSVIATCDEITIGNAEIIESGGSGA